MALFVFAPFVSVRIGFGFRARLVSTPFVALFFFLWPTAIFHDSCCYRPLCIPFVLLVVFVLGDSCPPGRAGAPSFRLNYPTKPWQQRPQ